MSFWLHESRVKRFARTVLIEVAQSVFVVAMSLLLVLAYYFFLFPLWTKNRLERQKIENQVTLIDQARKLKKTYDSVLQRVTASKVAMQELIEDAQSANQQYSMLVQSIGEYHLSCHNVQITPRQSMSYLSILPVCVQATGSFGNLFSWINHLSTNKHGVYCRSLVLTKKNNGQIGLDAKFYVMSYVDHEK